MGWLKDNLGTIVGGVVGYYSGGTMTAATKIAIGSAAGDYVQHGDIKSAMQAGAMGYAAGSGVESYQASNEVLPSNSVTGNTVTPVNPRTLTAKVNTTPGYLDSGAGSDLAGIGDPALINVGSTMQEVAPVVAETAGTESYWDKGIQFAKDNPSAVLTGGTLLYGAMQGEPDAPSMAKNEYDEYRKCLASGRGDCVAPASLYPTGRDHLPLGRSNMGRPQIDQSLIRPPPTLTRPQGIAALPSTQGRGAMTGLMDELNPRSM
tara:strand:+ start:46 stop:831 length:786 start_codon:yes stop_codon:yes gene_type:complete